MNAVAKVDQEDAEAAPVTLPVSAGAGAGAAAGEGGRAAGGRCACS